MTWVYRGNLRGPQGLPATGAAEDDAAVGVYVATDGTDTNAAVKSLVSEAIGEDVADYSFNVSSTTLGKWRSALVTAAGSGTARITVSGDSSPWGSGSGDAHLTSAWPGRLQRKFEEVYGKQGTGFMPMLLNYGTSGTASEQPILAFSTTGVTDSGFGVYQLGSKKLTGTSAWAQLSSAFGDVVRITFASSPGTTANVYVDDMTTPKGTIKTNLTATGTTYPSISGYGSNGAGLGLVVTDVPLGVRGYHTIRVVPIGGSSEEHLVGMETYVSPSRGVVVSNVALSGITTNHLVVDDVANGTYGMSVGFDLTRSHLHIIQIGTNDWQQHLTVSGFKSRLATAVRRGKTATPVANGGTPSNGNVLLVVNQWVDTASFPADHINSPDNNLYMQAVREVAVEEGAAGLDLRLMATSFADWNSKGYAADGLHPSQKGHEAIASAIFRLLSRVE